MMNSTLNVLLILAAAHAVTACSGGVSPDSPAPPLPMSQGVVVGFVRDSAGRGVANAVVCAAAAFGVSGTPTLVERQDTTTNTGAYVVRIDLTFKTDVRAGLTVAATPVPGSGLTPAYKSGLTVLIASTPPPSETTHADVVVPSGQPYNGVFCIFGP